MARWVITGKKMAGRAVRDILSIPTVHNLSDWENTMTLPDPKQGLVIVVIVKGRVMIPVDVARE